MNERTRENKRDRDNKGRYNRLFSGVTSDGRSREAVDMYGDLEGTIETNKSHVNANGVLDGQD